MLSFRLPALGSSDPRGSVALVPPTPGDTEPLSALAEEIALAEVASYGQLPRRMLVAAFGDRAVRLLFPDGRRPPRSVIEVRAELGGVWQELAVVLGPLEDALPQPVEHLCRQFIDELPEIHQRLVLDAAAIEAGDPAARSVSEVVLAYPGFAALAFHRLAHALHGLGIPLVPRLLAEVAHSRTGIDIHPGAQIGHACCIDHGTGLVIGETAVIGDAVKLYQGVTLGALSVAKSATGTKRHPTIEDRVVIYANATVLGGDTVVGHDSVIGGNVWLTNSVPPYSLVYHTSSVRVRSVAEASEPSDFVI
ncbi:MAG: serine O-acetyltransferase EpsC [Candidatus Limnocylindrales bacterium]